uniref:Uncharacterized protein n=1 Tax=Tanacetum cinerariifolium TaxID=118510 RepID=A0A6L2NN56_TANCI|nr:hypothetical protein [Tanacetum cinerariifolium]
MEHEGRECPSCLVRNEAVACRDPWSGSPQVEVYFQLVSSLCLWSPHVHGQKNSPFQLVLSVHGRRDCWLSGSGTAWFSSDMALCLSSSATMR